MKTTTTTLPINKIKPNPWNPNKMTPTQYTALKNSIKEYGGIMEGQRIIVTPTDNEYYRILNGEHRWRALKELGHDEAPVLIVELKDEAEEKLVSLALANTGEINTAQLLEIVETMMESYDIKDISKFLGESEEFLESYLTSESKNIDELLEEFSEISSKGNEINKLSVLNELGIKPSSNKPDDKKNVNFDPECDDFKVYATYFPPVRKALRIGYDKDMSLEKIITEAFRCFNKKMKED